MESISESWDENEKHMGEQAALHVACEMHGKTVEWFYSNFKLIAKKTENNNE